MIDSNRKFQENTQNKEQQQKNKKAVIGRVKVYNINELVKKIDDLIYFKYLLRHHCDDFPGDFAQ